MSFIVAEHIRSLAPYVPGKPISETQREFGVKKVVKLASNENPLGSPPRAIKLLQKLSKELHRYPDSSGFELKQALSEHEGLRQGDFILGNGSDNVIDVIVRSFAEPGDVMVTPQYSFIAYSICAKVQGLKTVNVPVDAKTFKVDPAQLVETVRREERARLVFIANPNNPTGTWLNRKELTYILDEVAKIRGGSVMVVLDYAYWEYVTTKDIPDPLALVKKYPNVVVLRTFSKVYGLAGLRVGYGVGQPDVIAVLEKVRQPFNVNLLGLSVCAEALNDRAFVKRARSVNTKGLEFWYKSLKKMDIPHWESQGNFVLVDVSDGGKRTAAEVNLGCLRRGLILRPVANYGLPNAIRITVGTPAENTFARKVLAEVMGRK